MAHYSKKLEKCGIIRTSTNVNSSEKRVTLVKREKIKANEAIFSCEMDKILNPKKIEALADLDVKNGKNSKRKRL